MKDEISKKDIRQAKVVLLGILMIIVWIGLAIWFKQSQNEELEMQRAANIKSFKNGGEIICPDSFFNASKNYIVSLEDGWTLHERQFRREILLLNPALCK